MSMNGCGGPTARPPISAVSAWPARIRLPPCLMQLVLLRAGGFLMWAPGPGPSPGWQPPRAHWSRRSTLNRACWRQPAATSRQPTYGAGCCRSCRSPPGASMPPSRTSSSTMSAIPRQQSPNCAVWSARAAGSPSLSGRTRSRRCSGCGLMSSRVPGRSAQHRCRRSRQARTSPALPAACPACSARPGSARSPAPPSAGCTAPIGKTGGLVLPTAALLASGTVQ